MNIFYLDKDPRLAAQYHNNKHVVKMILETAQLLSTAHHMLDGSNVPQGIYKATHRNHPSAFWIRSGVDQYRWGFDLFGFLIEEFHYRYMKPHACERLIPVLINNPINIDYDAPWTEPPQCMPDECRVEENAVEAYRNYYIAHKSHLAKWSVRNIPSWYSLKPIERV